jgi:hypothetical protein
MDWMSVSVRNRIQATISAFAFLFVSTTAIEPRAADAANTLGRTYEFGVFVARKRHEVSSTPIPVPTGHAFRVQGWVLDSRTMKPGMSLLVATDGGTPVPVRDYPLRRPDVVAALKDPGAEMSGFELTVPRLAKGVHRLHFTLIGNDRAVMGLSTDVLVTIGNY